MVIIITMSLLTINLKLLLTPIQLRKLIHWLIICPKENIPLNCFEEMTGIEERRNFMDLRLIAMQSYYQRQNLLVEK